MFKKNQSELKKMVALEALKFIKPDSVVGIGTGSTVNFFIEALAQKKNLIKSCVSSSNQTSALLKQYGLPIEDLNSLPYLDIYIDGADEINELNQMIKGGGNALTQEKIVAACSKKFVCIVDESKCVKILGKYPVPIEVIPMARSYVARELIKLGGQPIYREGVRTDNGNVILDIHNLNILKPIELEALINQITGVVTCGLFAKRKADSVLIATQNGVQERKDLGVFI